MNIVYCADFKISEILNNAIKSVCLHNEEVHFYLLHTDFPNEWFVEINRHLEKLGSKITNVLIEGEVFNGFRIPKYINSSAAFYRFFVGDIVKDRRALYLDYDTLVMGNLRKFYNIDFKNHACAMTPDVTLLNVPQFNGRLHKQPFYNAGVMLMNCDILRADEYPKLLVQTGAQINHEVLLGPVEIINEVLRENTLKLKNFCNHQVIPMERYQVPVEMEPLIVHFTGMIKPWHRGDQAIMPYRDKYWEIHNLTWEEVVRKGLGLD